MLIPLLVALLVVTAVMLTGIRVFPEYQRAVVFRLGRVRKQLAGPGVVLMLPLGIDRIRVVDTRPTSTAPLMPHGDTGCKHAASRYTRTSASGSAWPLMTWRQPVDGAMRHLRLTGASGGLRSTSMGAQHPRGAPPSASVDGELTLNVIASPSCTVTVNENAPSASLRVVASGVAPHSTDRKRFTVTLGGPLPRRMRSVGVWPGSWEVRATSHWGNRSNWMVPQPEPLPDEVPRQPGQPVRVNRIRLNRNWEDRLMAGALCSGCAECICCGPRCRSPATHDSHDTSLWPPRPSAGPSPGPRRHPGRWAGCCAMGKRTDSQLWSSLMGIPSTCPRSLAWLRTPCSSPWRRATSTSVSPSFRRARW